MNSGAEINLDGPTSPAPEGSVSILDNPPNGNHIAIAIITICVVISAFFYMIRFYSKYLGKKINLADYLTVVSFPLFWTYIYFSYRLSWTSGYLVHQWNIPLRDISSFSYVCWIATLLYLWIIALVKCSILLEWTEIFVVNGKNSYFAWTCYATCAAITSLSFILFVLAMVNCTPFAGNWDVLIPGSYCRFGLPQFGLASSATNLALDMIPLVLAQRVIWGLHMSWRKKLGVSLIFLIGIIGCIAASVRLYFATRFYLSNDTSYFYSIMALCSLCETTCANLILCVPFTPKAIMGLQQTKVFTELTSYLSLRSQPTYVNDTDPFVKATEPSAGKQDDDWIMMSKTNGNSTAITAHS